MFDTKEITPQQVLWGIVALIGLVFVISIWNKLHKPDDWEQKAKVAIQHADSLLAVNQFTLARADSLHKAGDQKSVEIKRLSQVADSLTKIGKIEHGKFLQEVTKAPVECKSVIESAKRVLAVDSMTVDTLRKAVAKAEGRDSLRLKEIDSLHTVIGRVNKSNTELSDELKVALRRDKLLGVVPMPSRTASFFIGAAAGIAVAAYIKR